MKNDNKTTMQMDSHQDNSNFITILFGAFLALCNHVFGWMNTLLDIQISGFIMTLFQAVLTGAFGAISAFYTNKFLKKYDKKKNEKRS